MRANRCYTKDVKIKVVASIILLSIIACAGPCGIVYAFPQDAPKTSCHSDSPDQSESSKSPAYSCCGEYVFNKSNGAQTKVESTLNSSGWLLGSRDILEYVSGLNAELRLSTKILGHPEVIKPIHYISVTTPIHAPPVSF